MNVNRIMLVMRGIAGMTQSVRFRSEVFFVSNPSMLNKITRTSKTEEIPKRTEIRSLIVS